MWVVTGLSLTGLQQAACARAVLGSTPADFTLQRCTAAGGRCAPLKSADTDPSTARAVLPRIFKFGMSENEEKDTLAFSTNRETSPADMHLAWLAAADPPQTRGDELHA